MVIKMAIYKLVKRGHFYFDGTLKIFVIEDFNKLYNRLNDIN